MKFKPLKFADLIFLGGCTLPIYVFPSGSVQPYHLLLFLYALYFSIRYGIAVDKYTSILVLLLSVVFCREYIALLNGASFILAMKPIAYLVFSIFIFQTYKRVFANHHHVMKFRNGLMVAVAVAFLGAVFAGYGPFRLYGPYRTVGTFNNPNQLGMFAVCVLSLISLLLFNGYLSRKSYIALVVCVFYLALVSLSKAAIISVAVTMVFYGFALSKGRYKIVISVAITAAIVGVIIYGINAGILDGYHFTHRITSIGSQSDDSAVARGYIPWFEHGALALLFGLSKPGAMSIIYGGHEVASTVASFFVYYGLLGGILFSAFLGRWIYLVWNRHNLIGVILICAPPLMDGLTHNGSRFTIFWMALALSFGLLGTQHTANGTNANRLTHDHSGYSAGRLL